MNSNNGDIKELEQEMLKPEAVEVLTPEEAAKLPVLEEMMKAGLMYGRKKSKTNPKMKPYVYAVRNSMAIFDLTKTLKNLETAAAFLKETAKKGGKILFVGTQPAARDLVKTIAEEYGQFFVNERWLGGILTNFKTVTARLQYFNDTRADA